MTVHPYSRIFTGKTSAPTVNSDSSAGYEVGDEWIDETGDKTYQAVDVTVGAAVWSAGGAGDVVGPASAVNNDLAAFDTTTGKLIKDSGVLTSDAASAVSLKHAAVTLDANADTLLSLSTQALGLDTQLANRFLGGAVSGGAAIPTFRTYRRSRKRGNFRCYPSPHSHSGANCLCHNRFSDRLENHQ